MAKHTYKNNKIIVVVITLLIIILGIIFLTSSYEKSLKEITLPQESNQQVDVLDTPLLDTPEISNTIKEAPLKASRKTIGKDGLCEDYFFEQGQSIKIDSHTVTVQKIATSSVKLVMDGEKYILGEGDSQYLGNKLKVSLKPGKLFYFKADDQSNSVVMRIGCNYNTDPNEKYVQERGRSICQKVYDDCQNSFDIEITR